MSKLIPSNKSGVKPGSNERAGLRGNGHSNGPANGQSNGHSNGNGHADHAERAVPTVKARVPAEPRPISRPTQLIPLVDATQPTENGEVQRTIVRPVKARVGNGSHGNGNGHHAGPGAGTVALNGVQHTTSRLRDTDLTSLRLRLKTDEWYQRPSERRSGVHKRPLPFFLMRHRTVRSRARVGHARTQAAARRYGKGGSAVLVARLMLIFVLLAGMVGASGVGAGFAGAAMYLNTLPPVNPEDPNFKNQGLNIETTKIYDRNGVPLYDLVSEEYGLRQELSLEEMSPLVISATIATEDGNFYNNPGIDMVGIVRAVNINLSGEGQSGASTITQQLVRQMILTQEERTQRTWQRKIKEAVLAVQLTREFSKDEILEMFMNQNFYGHRAYGVGAAALTYFGKPAKDLTLSEAALLAGLPQAPTEYDPLVYPEQAKRRQAIVLDLMAKGGMITREDAEAAKAETIVLRPYDPKIQAPHFVYYVKEYLEKQYGPDVSEAGLKVYTTLDLRVQEAAEQVARERIDELRKQKATNASIVIMKPGTGEILAMVGSVDYYNQEIDGQVNVATRERQPGSSFKPITFAAAFKKGWTPATVVLDTATSFPNPGQKPYIPKNYDGRDHGWVSVRQALANSYNIPAVKALHYAGVQETIDTAHAMGIKGLNRGTDWYGLSLTLGGGEVTLLDMTIAYSTFANEGVAVDANPILKIVDSQDRVIYGLDPNPSGNPALDPRIAYMITDILSDNQARSSAFGPNSPLKTSFPSAAKTGTTDDNRDSWTLGYTPNLTVGVWVGNSNNDEMLKVTGAIGAAVVWHNMMEAFYKRPEFVELLEKKDGKIQSEFVKPEGLITVAACSNKGTVRDLFLKEAPPKGCTNYKDPKSYTVLRAAPQPNNNNRPSNNNNRRPEARPTPLPGILPPQP